ncbi:MAG: AAA family ATPase [Deltaproteobacteria bacterium]|jgi:predicted ATP-binding protein involved in virulence|nr:AAA family ATPase [Deltaproteobacteria bacterium]
MQIKSIELENYRCFEKIKIEFDPRLTVLIGINASGKTAILEALAANLSLMAATLFHDQNQHLNENELFGKSDISKYFDKNYISSKLEVEDLTIEIQCNQNNLDLQREITAYEKNPSEDQIKMGFPELTTKIKNDIQKYATILVYYPAHRFLTRTEERNIGYNIASFEVSPFYYITSIIDHFRIAYSWFAEKNIAEAMKIRDLQKIDYRLPELETVRLAISKILFNKYEKPNFNIEEKEITIVEKKTKKKFNFFQLSQGFQSILAIAFDLSRRLAQAANMLNTNFLAESALNMPAIVLIDEIEMHLHPKWQQKVLPSLLNTFPKTQFIVTTHSPQVLTSIKPKNILILHKSNPQTVKADTFGAKSSDVMKYILKVDPRPNNKVKKYLKKYLQLVNQGEGKNEEAIKLRKKLERWISHDSILLDIDLFMNR